MSYTGTEILQLMSSVIDDLNSSGSPSANVADQKRVIGLLDLWQHEMMKASDVRKEYPISCYRKNNLLGDIGCFRIIENNGETQTYQAVGAHCFYLEVNGDCTLEISVGGSSVTGEYSFNGGTDTAFSDAISISVPESTLSPAQKPFYAIRGIFTADDSATVTMTISGSYYFRHMNRALSNYKFESASDVPDFKPWYKVDMPSDFKSRSQVIDEYPSFQYAEDSSHKWEGNELYVNFGYEGLIRIKYVPIPTKITALTQTLEIDEITAASAAYYLAEHFFRADTNDTAADRCAKKFETLKKEASIKGPLSFQEVVDVYG